MNALKLEELKDLRNAIDAHIAGNPVEFRSITWHESEPWRITGNPNWSKHCRYRPAKTPEQPKLIAWTLATYPADAKAFRRKQGTAIRPAIEISTSGIVLNQIMLDWDELLKYWQYTTTDFSESAWKPCGTLSNE